MYFPSRHTSSRRTPNTSYPTTASAAVHVRYLYLAGRYRDLSSEHGLGIAAGLDHVLEEERSRQGSNNAYISLTPTKRHDTAGAAAAAAGSSASSVYSLFLGAPTSPPRKDKHHPHRPTASSAAPHGAKHASLRGYALERLKRQERIEARIMRATDIKRLEWEAQAALLQSSHPLALLLLTRAGNLGSISACASLARLYALGITRGTLPAVVLVHRDPLRAAAWALEAFRLLRGSSAAQERNAQDTVQLLGLLTRVLRTDVAAPADFSTASVELPDIRQTTSLRSSGPPTPAIPQAHADLWSAVRDLDEWLEETCGADADVSVELEAGPDDEDETAIAALQSRALRLHASVLRALLRTRQFSADESRVDGDLERVLEAWKDVESQVHQGSNAKVPPSASELERLAREVLRSATTEPVLSFPTTIPSILEGSLAELAVPTALSARGNGNASVDTSDVDSIGSLSIRSPNGSLRGTPKKTRPSVAAAAAAHPRRRRSLEDLPPLTIEAAAATRPKLSTRILSETPGAQPSLSDVMAAPEAPLPSSAALTALAARRPGAASTLSSLRLNTRTSAPPLHANYESEPPSPADSLRSTASGFAFSSVPRQGGSGGGGLPRQRRPSSVVSDSPSLLFPPGEASTEDTTSSSRPASPAVSMMEYPTSTSTATRASLFRGASEGPGIVHMHDRRRVSSLYGAPSASAASDVDGSSEYGWGSVTSPLSSVSSGAAGLTGYFDPTASLRRMAGARSNQGHVRRDSNASVTSIGSVRSLFNPPSAVAGMGTLRSPPAPPAASTRTGASFELGRRAPGSGGGAGAGGEESAQAQISGSASFGRQAADSLRRLRNLAGGGGGGSGSRAGGSIRDMWPGGNGEPRRRTASSASMPAHLLNGHGSRPPKLGALKPTPARPLSTILPASFEAQQLFPPAALLSPTSSASDSVPQPRTPLDGTPGVSASASALKSLRAVGERARPKAPPQALVLETRSPAAASTGAPAPPPPISPLEEGEPFAPGRIPLHKQRHDLPPRELSIAAVRQAQGAATMKRQGSGRSFAGIDPTHGAYGSGSGTASAVGSGSTTPIHELERPALLSPRLLVVPPPFSPHSSASASGSTSPTTSSRSSSDHAHSPTHLTPGTELDPALAAAESRSRLKTDARCDVCGRQVVNAPVSRSGRKFCGRECRVRDKAREKELRAAKERGVGEGEGEGRGGGGAVMDDEGYGEGVGKGKGKVVEQTPALMSPTRAVRFA